MCKVAILQSNYIPWKGYFDIIHDVDIFVYYDEVKYTKNDWRNRNKIYPKNGLQWLTIPISKDAVRLKISEVLLGNEHWQEQHYKSMAFSYGKSSHFGQIDMLAQDIYLQHHWSSLSELNQYVIEKIARYIGIETRFVDSRDLVLAGDRVERLISILQQLGADEYVSGPSARAYLHGHEHLFTENQIRLVYKDYTGYPSYPQLATPFEHAVSIVDMIANIDHEQIPSYIWGWRTPGSPHDFSQPLDKENL